MGSEAADKRLERWDEVLDNLLAEWKAAPGAFASNPFPVVSQEWFKAVRDAAKPALRQEEPGGKRSV